MTPEWVTASAAIATTSLAAVIAFVNAATWWYQRRETKRQLELSGGDWEMLHILTRYDNGGLLAFSIHVDWDSDEGSEDEMPERLDLPGFFAEDLRRLVAKGILYKAPGSSRRDASFRFTDEGRRKVRCDKAKIANWYEWEE